MRLKLIYTYIEDNAWLSEKVVGSQSAGIPVSIPNPHPTYALFLL